MASEMKKRIIKLVDDSDIKATEQLENEFCMKWFWAFKGSEAHIKIELGKVTIWTTGIKMLSGIEGAQKQLIFQNKIVKLAIAIQEMIDG